MKIPVVFLEPPLGAVGFPGGLVLLTGEHLA